MTHEQFAALVSRLEDRARRNPGSYKRHVLMLAFAAYAYLGFVLLALVLLAVAAVAVGARVPGLALKLVALIVALIWLVLRAMRVRLIPPQGRALTAKEAPALFAVIDSLRRELDAPRLHKVLVSNQVNAAISQVPLLGLWGWPRNYRVIGLPLMMLLTPQQFESVLAHEFGHLSGGHGRTSSWLYRLRITWTRILMVLEQQQHWGRFAFVPFFKWYVPYFQAYSFPLARANEYEADAASARLISATAAAEALTITDVAASYLNDRFWPTIRVLADDRPLPVPAFSMLRERIADGFDETDLRKRIARTLKQPTGLDDTHPSLADRLKAIGQLAQIALPAPGGAADSLLGKSGPSVVAYFDDEWSKATLPFWKRRYLEVQEGRARLAELNALAAAAELPVPDALTRARLTEAFGQDASAALEQYRAVLERDPDNAPATYMVGRLLLARDDEAGFALIEKAIRLDDEASEPGYQLLRDHCRSKGRTDEAQAWEKRLQEWQQRNQVLRAERYRLRPTDKLEPHDLPMTLLADLTRQLHAVPGVRQCYLVRKQVERQPNKPLLILAFSCNGWWPARSRKRADAIRKRIIAALQFPGELLVLNLEECGWRLRMRIRRVVGSQI